MNKKMRLILITVAVAVVLAVATGVTVAELVSSHSQSASLRTANLELSAKAEKVLVYTAVPAAEGDDDTFADENGKRYKYAQSAVQGDDVPIPFGHGGVVRLSTDADGNSGVTIDGMLPGDKVEFDIVVTSQSTIAFNYRAELYVDDTDGKALAEALRFDAGELDMHRKDVPAEEGSADYLPAVITDYTEVRPVSGNQVSVDKVHVTVTLPITAQAGQGQSVRITYVACGIQNLEEQPDVAQVQDGTASVPFKTLGDAVAYAEAHGLGEIQVVHDTVLPEEGTITVSRGLRFAGTPDEKGNLPKIKGARISVTGASAATFENLCFVGESYIDVTDCAALTLNNCRADTEAVKFFDENMRNYLSDAAFVVAGSSRTRTKLTVTDSTFVADQGAAVCMRSRLDDESSFAGNTFGAADKAYGGTAVFVLGGAGANAVVTLQDNEIFGALPLLLGNGNGERYKVISRGNVAQGVTGAFVRGTAQAAFYDSGSRKNGANLTCADIDAAALLFGGVDVTLDGGLRISAGKFAVSESNLSMQDFYFSYIVGGTLARNAVALYRGGELYGYMNSTASGFEITAA